MLTFPATTLMITAWLSAVTQGTEAAPRIDPAVHRTLWEQGTVHLMVTMKEGTDKVLKSDMQEADLTFADRGARIEDLVLRLTQHAQESQREVHAQLEQRESTDDSTALFTSSESFWISNQLFFREATAPLVERLRSLSGVAEIREEKVFPLPPVVPVDTSVATNSSASSFTPTAASGPEWGITKVAATDVWSKDDNKGEGIIVSAIDSGVLGTHEALQANYRGAYGWFDPESKKPEPYDSNGHGTHTMGTIAGANGIGVAPGATWMSCKGCRSESCPESDLLACAQFITCPTDAQGENKDCSKAPHVVSNSWGGGQGDSFFQSAVEAWHKAGIIPVFAIGNSGPKCGSANSPGDYANVISVGATDSSDTLASFSSKGPTSNGNLLKPEISGPGVDVRSAWNSGATSYKSISGTSMATPHVTGCIALLLKAEPGMTYDQVKTRLTATAETAQLKATQETCGGTADGQFPNNMYGYGLVDAYRAIHDSDAVVPTSAPPSSSPTPPPPPPPSSPCADRAEAQCYALPMCIWTGNECVFWGHASTPVAP